MEPDVDSAEPGRRPNVGRRAIRTPVRTADVVREVTHSLRLSPPPANHGARSDMANFASSNIQCEKCTPLF